MAPRRSARRCSVRRPLCSTSASSTPLPAKQPQTARPSGPPSGRRSRHGWPPPSPGTSPRPGCRCGPRQWCASRACCGSSPAGSPSTPPRCSASPTCVGHTSRPTSCTCPPGPRPAAAGCPRSVSPNTLAPCAPASSGSPNGTATTSPPACSCFLAICRCGTTRCPASSTTPRSPSSCRPRALTTTRSSDCVWSSWPAPACARANSSTSQSIPSCRSAPRTGCTCRSANCAPTATSPCIPNSRISSTPGSPPDPPACAAATCSSSTANASAKAAGIGHVSPHRLRHTLATQAINRGMTLEALAALLGHRSMRMTLVYARIADRTVADEYFSVSEKVEALYNQPRALPADAEGAEMRKLRVEMHRRMLGNGYCARPVGLDCHFESICESCTFFQTTIEFRPTLQAQRDDAAEKGQLGRQKVFDGLLARLDQTAS